MVRWVVGSILHGEPIELFLVPVTLVLYSLSHFKPELYNVVTSVLQSHSDNYFILWLNQLWICMLIWFVLQYCEPGSFHWMFVSLMLHPKWGARCSSVVRVFAHGAMGRRIDPSWWTHWAISHSRQCSTTGVTKAVVYVIPSDAYKELLLLIGKSIPCGGSRFPLSLSEWSFTIIYVLSQYQTNH